MPKKKSATKKTVAIKTPVKKTAKKAVKKAAPKAPKAVKKTVEKAAAKKATVAKKASKGRRKTAGGTTGNSPMKGKTTRKASDFVKRASHTPAIFKPASKKPIHILFTMDDVREVLRKRAAEEKHEAAVRKAAAKKAGTVHDQPKLEEVVPLKSKHSAASLDDILGLSGGPGTSRQGAGNVPRKFQKYHKLLLQLRDEVREELNLHSSDTLKRSQKEDTGDIATSVDAGTDSFDRDFALSLLSTEQEALNEIEAAIQRIYKGLYGVCEVTGEPINEERLEAVPFTRFSVEGQNQHELNIRRRVSRAGAFLNEASGEKISFGDDDGEN